MLLLIPDDDLKLRCFYLENSVYTRTVSFMPAAQKNEKAEWVSLYTAALRMRTAPAERHSTKPTVQGVLSEGSAILYVADT